VQELAGNRPTGRRERDDKSEITLEEYVARTVLFYSPERGRYIMKDSLIGQLGINYKKELFN
jgi:hypothetical protein